MYYFITQFDFYEEIILDAIIGAKVESKSFEYSLKCLQFILNREGSINKYSKHKIIYDAFAKILKSDSKKGSNFLINLDTIFNCQNSDHLKVIIFNKIIIDHGLFKLFSECMEKILINPEISNAGDVKLMTETMRLCLAADCNLVDEIPLYSLEQCMQLLSYFNYQVG